MINPDGIEIIKKFEGFRAEAYKCPAGVWTIGYGRAHGVKPGDRITEIQADAFLREDLKTIENELKYVMARKPVNINQWSAIVCLCFNIGIGNFEKSEIFKYLPYSCQKSADSFLLYDKAHVHGKTCVLPGLLKRREAERLLFLK